MTIIDVREPFEYQAGHVDGAVNIPVGEIQSVELPRDEAIVVYCRSGARSGMAQQALQAMGYTNVTNGINQQAIESGQA